MKPSANSAGMHNATAPRNIALLEMYCPAAPIAPAVRAFPAATNALLRPVRVDMAPRPTRPRLSAAIAGVTMPPLIPCKISAAKTRAKVGARAKIRPDAPIMTIPNAARPRFHGAQSTMGSAGNMRDQAGDSTSGQSEPHVTFVPAQIRKIKSDERAEASLNVGKEEIQPIEPLPALF